MCGKLWGKASSRHSPREEALILVCTQLLDKAGAPQSQADEKIIASTNHYNDFNAASEVWGSQETKARGTAVELLCNLTYDNLLELDNLPQDVELAGYEDDLCVTVQVSDGRALKTWTNLALAEAALWIEIY